MASNRALKVADRIREVVAMALETRVKDPRLGFITLTDVRVTGDLQQASIFYTVLGDQAARESTAAALNSAKGLLRAEVGRALGLRITPTLEFFLDGLQESASAMNELISEVKNRDAELERLRKEAQYAGEADPYKHEKAE
jgi:ribosome-binding factor A